MRYVKEAFNDGYKLGKNHSKIQWIMIGMSIGFIVSSMMYIFVVFN